MTDEKLARYIAILVSGVWFFSIMLDAFWKPYDPPSTINGLMMLIVGWAVSADVRNRKEKKEEKPKVIDETDKEGEA